MTSDRVVDTSALISALDPHGEAAREAIGDGVRHAPHLIDAELGQVLRRQVRSGALSAKQGASLLYVATRGIDTRYPHQPLHAAAWELRDRLSFYDALFVALAARLGIPLVTGDKRLTNAPGLPCRVIAPQN